MAWYIVLAVVALTLVYIAYNYVRIRKMSEGTADMMEMAAIIREGATTFMKTEYKTISIVTLVVALIFSLFVEKTSGVTFLLGACMSSIHLVLVIHAVGIPCFDCIVFNLYNLQFIVLCQSYVQHILGVVVRASSKEQLSRKCSQIPALLTYQIEAICHRRLSRNIERTGDAEFAVNHFDLNVSGFFQCKDDIVTIVTGYTC